MTVHTLRLSTLLGLSLTATTLFAGAVLLGTPRAAHAQAESAASSPLAGVALPKGAERQTDSGLTSGLGKLMAAGAKEFKLPPRDGGPGDAEVYFWTGARYKEDRVPFLRTMLQNALAEAGYTYTEVDPAAENTPNAFDEDAYGTGAIAITPADPRLLYFHASNPKKGKTLVGVWINQPSQNRLVLAMGEAGFAGAPVETVVPDVSGDAWLVKDPKHATQGMPPAPLPAFPKLAKKPGTVRGVVEDGSGKPIANAHLIAWCSAAGGFRTSHDGRTNAKGVYEIPLPVGIGQIVNADCRVEYNGKEYLLPLHPADGERDQFDAKAGHIENFVLRASGAAGADGRTYGAPVRVLDWSTPDGSTIELTFKPVGPLLDGGRGKTLVFRYKSGGQLGGEKFLGDIPIGHYTLTAKVYDGDDALPLRLQKTFSDGEDNPLQGALDVTFDAANTDLASLGDTGIRRFEVTVKP